ncbi:MAG: prepilin-type N-terminal cleavage/methylation domain-containing protein [Armatimonadota bacterium]|nr:prepilin-type N-terminal cleavage/methylation domain-containing protein [Armatimonadota bacterium]
MMMVSARGGEASRILPIGDPTVGEKEAVEMRRGFTLIELLVVIAII